MMRNAGPRKPYESAGPMSMMRNGWGSTPNMVGSNMVGSKEIVLPGTIHLTYENVGLICQQTGISLNDPSYPIIVNNILRLCFILISSNMGNLQDLLSIYALSKIISQYDWPSSDMIMSNGMKYLDAILISKFALFMLMSIKERNKRHEKARHENKRHENERYEKARDENEQHEKARDENEQHEKARDEKGRHEKGRDENNLGYRSSPTSEYKDIRIAVGQIFTQVADYTRTHNFVKFKQINPDWERLKTLQNGALPPPGPGGSVFIPLTMNELSNDPDFFLLRNIKLTCEEILRSNTRSAETHEPAAQPGWRNKLSSASAKVGSFFRRGGRMHSMRKLSHRKRSHRKRSHRKRSHRKRSHRKLSHHNKTKNKK